MRRTRRIANFNVNTISERFKTYISMVAGNVMVKLSKLLNKYNGNSETYLRRILQTTLLSPKSRTGKSGAYRYNYKKLQSQSGAEHIKKVFLSSHVTKWF